MNAEGRRRNRCACKSYGEGRGSLERLKGPIKKASQTSDELRDDLDDAENQIAYLEALLAFEERSGYSSMISELKTRVKASQDRKYPFRAHMSLTMP